MKYKAVLFDMDGTVLDTLDDLAAAVNAALCEFKLPQVDIAQVRAGLGNGAARLIDFCVPGDCPVDIREELLAFYMAYYNANCKLKTAPYEGIIPLLQRLKAAGLRLAVISNKQDAAVKALAAEFFPGLLESAIGESETVRRKPNPDAVLSAAKHFDVEVKDCVYVGDSEVDVQTAKNAGMDCVAVSWGFRSAEQLEKAGAERIANKVNDLYEYLK